MIDAILLTICICGGGFAATYIKVDSDYNRSMKDIFGNEYEFSIMDTPFLCPPPKKDGR